MSHLTLLLGETHRVCLHDPPASEWYSPPFVSKLWSCDFLHRDFRIFTFGSFNDCHLRSVVEPLKSSGQHSVGSLDGIWLYPTVPLPSRSCPKGKQLRQELGSVHTRKIRKQVWQGRSKTIGTQKPVCFEHHIPFSTIPLNIWCSMATTPLKFKIVPIFLTHTFSQSKQPSHFSAFFSCVFGHALTLMDPDNPQPGQDAHRSRRTSDVLPSLAWRLVFVAVSLGWLDPPSHVFTELTSSKF